MKTAFFLAILSAITLQGVAQQTSNEPIVRTTASGTVRSVEFPQGVNSKAIPSTSAQFFNSTLGVKPTDEFRFESQQVSYTLRVFKNP